MKKLSKLKLSLNANPMNDSEMKMIVGGYTNSYGCPAQSSSCSGSCTTSTGRSGTCSTFNFNGTTLCACYEK